MALTKQNQLVKFAAGSATGYAGLGTYDESFMYVITSGASSSGETALYKGSIQIANTRVVGTAGSIVVVRTGGEDIVASSVQIATTITTGATGNANDNNVPTNAAVTAYVDNTVNTIITGYVSGVTLTGEHLSVSSALTNHVVNLTANVQTTGSVADGNTGIVNGGTVYSALTAVSSNAKVYVTSTAGSSSDNYLKKYTLYQGSGTSASPIAAEKLCDIDIPKDFVVKSGTVSTVTTANTPYQGAVVGDKYIDLTLNVYEGSATSSHIYIPVKDLVDVYTGGNNIEVTNANVINVTGFVTNGTGITSGDTTGIVTPKAVYEYANDAISTSLSAISLNGTNITGVNRVASFTALTAVQTAATTDYVAWTLGESNHVVTGSLSVSTAATSADIASATSSTKKLATDYGVQQYVSGVVGAQKALTAISINGKTSAATNHASSASFTGLVTGVAFNYGSTSASSSDFISHAASVSSAGTMTFNTTVDVVTTSGALETTDFSSDDKLVSAGALQDVLSWYVF